MGSRSNFSWNPHRNKIAAGERDCTCRGSQKYTRRKKTTLSVFCIIQISSKLFFFYLTIYVFTEVCRIQKTKEKGLTKLIRSFGNVTDQTEGNYRFLVILIKNICSSRLLLRTLSFRLILASPEILGTTLRWVLQ